MDARARRVGPARHIDAALAHGRYNMAVAGQRPLLILVGRVRVVRVTPKHLDRGIVLA